MGKADIKNQKKYFVMVLCLTVLLALILHYCGNVTGDRVGGLVYDLSDKASITDETPLNSMENKIVFPGFSTKTVAYDKSDKMSLQNPKSNRVDFVYAIEYEGEEVYRSDLISPGYVKKWDLHEVFSEQGQYEITIHITPYDSTGSEKNGFKQEFTFKII